MSENSIIAIIEFNKEKYIIYSVKGKINYASYKNGKIINNIDLKHKEILDNFYNLIRFDRNHSYYCGKYKIDNNEFEIYQDIRSKLYSFIQVKNKKRCIPTLEHTIMLNSYFNNDDFIFANEQSKTNNKLKALKFVKKVLTFSGMNVLALIASGVVLYNIPQVTKNNIDYELGKIVKHDLTKKEKSYTFEDLKNAIKENNNISEKNREFIEDVLEAEFEENKKYMDIESIIKKLRTVEIQYKDEDAEEYKSNRSNGVVAYYNAFYNQITYLQTKRDSEFDNINKSGYYHELNHLLTVYDIDSVLSSIAEKMEFVDSFQKTWNTSFFRETIDEIFSQEYIDEYYQKNPKENRSHGYTDKLPYMYCLAEILPTEVLREYKFNDNDSIITEGLLDIIDNKTETYKLMTSLKSLDLDDDENYERIHDGLAFFYKHRYGKEMSNDMDILLYLYNTPAITDVEKKKVNTFLGIENNTKLKIEPKGYFSKNYISRHPNTKVMDRDKIVIIKKEFEQER